MRITGNPEYTPQYLLSQIIDISYNKDHQESGIYTSILVISDNYYTV